MADGVLAEGDYLAYNLREGDRAATTEASRRHSVEQKSV